MHGGVDVGFRGGKERKGKSEARMKINEEVCGGGNSGQAQSLGV